MSSYLHSHHSFLSLFFNDTATTEIYTLSLHDALPIYRATRWSTVLVAAPFGVAAADVVVEPPADGPTRSEEHTSELQSRRDLVCRLLLEKKKKKNTSVHCSDVVRTTHTLRERALIATG